MSDQEKVTKHNSLSVVVPIFNEAVDIQGTYESINRALNIAGIADYEILFVTQAAPDGRRYNSSDAVDSIAATDPRVSHIANPFFVGLGLQYKQGIYAASKDYTMLIPPHNPVEESSLASLMLHVGEVDTIFTYTANPEVRPAQIRYVSSGYTTLCNLLFGLDVKSYSGILVVDRGVLLKVPAQSNNSAYLAEVIVYLARMGLQYLELPQLLKANDNFERYRDVASMSEIAGSIFSLFWRISVNGERLDISRGVALSHKTDIALPCSDGLPDLSAIYQFAGKNSIQTLHQIIVYVAKSIDKRLDLSNMKDDHWSGWSTKSQDAFNAFRVIKTFGSLAAKIISKIAVIDTGYNKPPKRKKGGRKKKPVSLTVIMPAYNVAADLPSAYERATRALRKAGVSDYEILIASSVGRDKTHDGTPDIADKIASEDPKVRHLFDDSFQNLGYRFRQGVGAAQKEYIMWVPGDGEFNEDSTAEVISYIGEAEIIIPFIANQEVRPQERQIASRTFTVLCNTMFGLNLRYYNGLCIIPARYLKEVPMSCDNFAYMAEILIYLLKSGAKYIEVPWKIKRVEGSKAFKAESVNEVLETLVSLFWKINIEGVRIKIPK